MSRTGRAGGTSDDTTASRSDRDAALGSERRWRSPAPPDGLPHRGRAPFDHGRPVKEPSASEHLDRRHLTGPADDGRMALIRGPIGPAASGRWVASLSVQRAHGARAVRTDDCAVERAKLGVVRLELTHRGSYAIRAVLALARANDADVVPARRIAKEMDIPVRFLPQVLGDLSRAGHRRGTTRSCRWLPAVAADRADQPARHHRGHRGRCPPPDVRAHRQALRAGPRAVRRPRHVLRRPGGDPGAPG